MMPRKSGRLSKSAAKEEELLSEEVPPPAEEANVEDQPEEEIVEEGAEEGGEVVGNEEGEGGDNVENEEGEGGDNVENEEIEALEAEENEQTVDDSGIDVENADETGHNGDLAEEGDENEEPQEDDVGEMEHAEEGEEEEDAQGAAAEKQSDEAKDDDTVSAPVIILDDSGDEKKGAKKKKDKKDSEEAPKSKKEEDDNASEKKKTVYAPTEEYPEVKFYDETRGQMWKVKKDLRANLALREEDSKVFIVITPDTRRRQPPAEQIKAAEEAIDKVWCKEACEKLMAENKKREENKNLPLIAVSGLSYHTRSADLRTIFSPHCTVVDIHIMHSTRNRPRAHITVSTQEEVAECVKTLNKKEIQGRRVWVEEIKPIKRCEDEKDKGNATTKEGGEEAENNISGETKGNADNNNEEENDRYIRRRRSGSRSRRRTRSRSRSRRYRRSPPEREYHNRREFYRPRYEERTRYQDRYRPRIRDEREERDNREARLRRRHEEEKLEIEEKRLEREKAELLRLKAERTRIERQKIEMEKEMLLRDTRKLTEKRKLDDMTRHSSSSFYKMMRRESDDEDPYRYKKRDSSRGYDDESDGDKRKMGGPKGSDMWVSGAHDHYMSSKGASNQQQSWPTLIDTPRWPPMKEGMRMPRLPRPSVPRHMGSQNFARPYGGPRF